MKKRNESIVFFEQKLDASRTLTFLDEFSSRTGLHATMLHLLIYASAQIIKERPHMNRFVAGGRIFQRRGIWISFSPKKRKTEDAPIVLVKREIDPSWSFEELVKQIEGGISEGRSDKLSTTDAELSLMFKLPVFLIGWMVWLLIKLDHLGLLPGFFTSKDPGSRTTPTVESDRVYTVGMVGDLYCISTATQKPVWHKNIWTDFGGGSAVPPNPFAPPAAGGQLPIWGIVQNPLIYRDLLILASQAPQAGVVAYDKATGDIKWKTAPLAGETSQSSPLNSGTSYVSPSLVQVGAEDHLVMITAAMGFGRTASGGKSSALTR